MFFKKMKSFRFYHDAVNREELTIILVNHRSTSLKCQQKSQVHTAV